MTTIPNIDQLVPVVGNDFIDADGVRRFSFSLCEQREGKPVAIAIVDIVGNKTVERLMTIGALTHYRKQVEELAFYWQARHAPFDCRNRNVELEVFHR